MDEEVFNDFVIGKWKWVVYVIKALLVMNQFFWVLSKGIYHKNLQSLL